MSRTGRLTSHLMDGGHQTIQVSGAARARARRVTPGRVAASAAEVADPNPVLGRARADASAAGSLAWAAASTGPSGVARATSAARLVRATIVAEANQAGPPGQPATFGGDIGTCPASRSRASWRR